MLITPWLMLSGLGKVESACVCEERMHRKLKVVLRLVERDILIEYLVAGYHTVTGWSNMLMVLELVEKYTDRKVIQNGSIFIYVGGTKNSFM